jgi:LysM repeat protein
MKHAALLIVIAPFLLAGCTTLIDERRSESMETEVQNKIAVDNTKDKLEMLEERIKAIEVRQEDLEKDMTSLRMSVENENREARNAMTAAEQALKANDASMARFKQEIIAGVATNVSEALRAQSTSHPQPQSQTGREHVVQQGESLSLIAAAYKVKASAIIEANGLKNANSIKVGQKLFIPEDEPATPRH